MSGGGGRRWREEQREVLDHAEGLGYGHYAGGSLIEETDDKAKWVAWRDKFGDFKSDQLAKPQEQRWWVTRPWTADEGTSHHGESSGHSGGLLSPPPGSINRGPYPLPNEYFPLLTTDYVRPQAIPGDAYMNRYFNQGAYQVPNAFPALSYQPGTEQYHEAFPLHESILEYQPNRFGVGPVQFMGTLDGPMNVVPPEELFTEEEDDEYDWATDPEGRKSGGHVGPPGSQASGYGVAQGTQTGTTSTSANDDPSDIRLKKNIKFLGKSNTLDINKLRSNSI